MASTGINLSEVRNFSDMFTATFYFIKQEIKSLLTCFSVLVLPLVLVDLFIKSYAMNGLFLLRSAEAMHQSGVRGMALLLFSYVMTLILIYWLVLFVVSYLRVYHQKYRLEEKIKVLPGEVWTVMCRKMLKVFALSVVLSLVIVIGFIFLIIPGIYLAVIFSFSIYFLIIRDQTISGSLGASKDLCDGQWWALFGYTLLLQLIVTMLAYVFAIPYMVIIFKAAFTGHAPGIFELTIGTLFTQLGQYLMYMILFIGIGIRFFSTLEQREHATLLEKIEQIGADAETERSEGSF